MGYSRKSNKNHIIEYDIQKQENYIKNQEYYKYLSI